MRVHLYTTILLSVIYPTLSLHYVGHSVQVTRCTLPIIYLLYTLLTLSTIGVILATSVQITLTLPLSNIAYLPYPLSACITVQMARCPLLV
jgi:hypothetical protein